MASLDDLLAALFASLGPIGSLVTLLLIFAVDAALFPALPEAWILITYTFRPEALVAVGRLAKYAVLLYLVFFIGVAYDPRTARSITLGLVVAVVALSLVGSWLYRRRKRTRMAR